MNNASDLSTRLAFIRFPKLSEKLGFRVSIRSNWKLIRVGFYLGFLEFESSHLVNYIIASVSNFCLPATLDCSCEVHEFYLSLYVVDSKIRVTEYHLSWTVVKIQSFSAVVGPNGSGKSNVIDAMLFVFGKRAKQVCTHSILFCC